MMTNFELGLSQAGRVMAVESPRVLIVSDDAKEVDYYADILRERGYWVRALGSFAEANASIAQEPFDLIIVGQGGPDFKGRTVLEGAVERDRQMPVLVLTRSVNIDCYLDAMQLGAVDYVETPLVPAELANLVSTHVRARSLAA